MERWSWWVGENGSDIERKKQRKKDALEHGLESEREGNGEKLAEMVYIECIQ